MGNVVFAGERFVRPHDPRYHGDTVSWLCMDDRFALLNGLYRQIGGGVLGVGQAWGAALRMGGAESDAKPLHETGPHGEPKYIHVLGGIAAKALKGSGIKLFSHQGCAAEANAQPITKAVVERPAEVFAVVQQVKPGGMDRDRYDEITEAFSRLPVAAPVQAAEELDNGRLWTPSGSDAKPITINPVPRISLAPMEHVASDVLIDYQEGVAFDPRAAMEHGSPAYHVSIGDLENEIHPELHDLIPINRDDFVDAAIVGHAATILHLPRQNPDVPLQIHVLDAA